ncbi:MAG TPA: hypothetical protein VIN60_11260 [Anaerolineales bacterium]
MQHLFQISKRMAAFVGILILLTACAPSQAAIQTAIAQTQSAYTPTPNLGSIVFATPALSTPTSISTATPIPSPTPKAGTADSPIPFNAKGTLTDPLSGGTFDLQVQQVVRGGQASYLIQQASTKNLNPPQGMEYILIKVTVTLDSGDLNLGDYDFIVSSHGNLSDSFSSPVCCMTNVGYQVFHAELSSLGSSTDGWIIRMAYINDPKPLLVYRADQGNNLTNATYFSLTPTTQSP